MKLFFSPASPFARKVMMTALAGGLADRITIIPTDPWVSPPDLLAQNPLSKIPCLVTEDGLALFDSPVICEYLDNIGDSAVFPAPGPARWRALKQQAVGDGIVDAGILRRREEMRPAEDARMVAIARHKSVVTQALDLLEQSPPADHLDIGTISIVAALGWLDFRYKAEDWRVNRPHLAAWYEAMLTRPEVAQTMPR